MAEFKVDNFLSRTVDFFSEISPDAARRREQIQSSEAYRAAGGLFDFFSGDLVAGPPDPSIPDVGVGGGDTRTFGERAFDGFKELLPGFAAMEYDAATDTFGSPVVDQLGGLVGRAATIILGFIFVAIGLNMFRPR